MKEITMDERTAFTDRYKKASDNGTLVTATEYELTPGNVVSEEILGFAFDAATITEKIIDTGANKILIEFGAHEDNTICLVLTLMKDGFAVTSYEWSMICPPYCP